MHGHLPLGQTKAPDPICVDCGTPYPRRGGPLVTRCVECQAKRDDPEHENRMRRIESAAPPASSFEGQLQRWRDSREEIEFETVWNGGPGLTTMTERRG
jgi:hypothetical protein